MPVFRGEPDKSGRVAPIAVHDFVDRINAYFSSNAGQYASEQHKLSALLNAFPLQSPAGGPL